MTQATAAEQFEATKKQVTALNERGARLKGQRESITTQLAEARAEAVALFKTSEVPALRQQLADTNAHNSEVLAVTQASATQVETVFSRIEFLLANPDRLLELAPELAEQPSATEPVSTDNQPDYAGEI